MRSLPNTRSEQASKQAKQASKQTNKQTNKQTQHKITYYNQVFTVLSTRL